MTTDVQAAPDEATKAEWHALIDRTDKLRSKVEHERGMVALYMIDHLAAGGMAPAVYGIAAEDALVAYRRACEHTEAVRTAEDEYADNRATIEAHPFQLHLERLRSEKESAVTA